MARRADVALYKIEWAGLEAFRTKLESLGEKLGRKILTKATNAAARIVLLQVRRTTPVRPAGTNKGKFPPGALKRSWIVKSKFYSNTGTAVALVGPRSKAAPHAHLVEFGTVERFRKPRGAGGTIALQDDETKWVQVGTRFVQLRKGAEGKTGLRTGRMPASHILRNAYESKAHNVKARLLWRIKGEIAAEAAKDIPLA